MMAFMAFPLAGLLSGCYPEKIDYVDEYDLAGRSNITARVRYVSAFKTEEAPTLSYLSFGLGLAW